MIYVILALVVFTNQLSAEQNDADQKSFEAAKLKAEKGDAQAQDDLAVFYNKGLGVTRDSIEAAKWFRKAADQGIVGSQLGLGFCYFSGRGVPKDYAEAIKWFRKAADQGSAEAQDMLGDFYVQNSDDFPGVPGVSDYWTAAKWYRTAADQGYIDAENKLGLCYFNGGMGLGKDYEEAAKWFRKAADQGYADAQYNLADCYSKGLGVTQDDEQAVNWFRKAADKGIAQAQYKLGSCYYFGNGVTKDYSEAVKWCRKAADQGNAEARHDLHNFVRALKSSQPPTDDSTMPSASLEKLDDADAYFKRSNVEYTKRNLDDAWADLNKTIELKPDFALAYLGRASVKYAKGGASGALADQNVLDAAMADLKNYLKYKPDAEAYDIVGNWMWNNGYSVNSESYYNKAIELKPDFAEAYSHRGDIEQFKSIYGATRLDKALTDYNKAIELKPDLADAYLGRSSVKQKLDDLDGSKADRETFMSIQSKSK